MCVSRYFAVHQRWDFGQCSILNMRRTTCRDCDTTNNPLLPSTTQWRSHVCPKDNEKQHIRAVRRSFYIFPQIYYPYSVAFLGLAPMPPVCRQWAVLRGGFVLLLCNLLSAWQLRRCWLCISCLLVRGFVLAERRARRPGMLHTTDATIQRSQLDVQRYNGAAQRRTRDVRLTDVCGWCQVLPTWEQRDKPVRQARCQHVYTKQWQRMCTNDRLYLYRITRIVVFFSSNIIRFRIGFDLWLHDESVVQSSNDFI